LPTASASLPYPLLGFGDSFHTIDMAAFAPLFERA